MICPVCGGSEFIEESGKQACAECGTINHQYVEVEGDEEDQIAAASHRIGKLRVLNITNKVESKQTAEKKMMDKKFGVCSSWSTYEAMTLVLQEWAEALVRLGASRTLPDIILRLWAGYLSKMEIAFQDGEKNKKKMKSELSGKRPKIGLFRNKRDVDIVHMDTKSVSHKSLSSWSQKSTVEGPKSDFDKMKSRMAKRRHRQKVMNLKTNASIAASDLSKVLLMMNENEDSNEEESENISKDSYGKQKTEPTHPLANIEKKRVLRSAAVMRWLTEGNKSIYLDEDTVPEQENEDNHNDIADEPPKKKRKLSSQSNVVGDNVTDDVPKSKKCTVVTPNTPILNLRDCNLTSIECSPELLRPISENADDSNSALQEFKFNEQQFESSSIESSAIDNHSNLDVLMEPYYATVTNTDDNDGDLTFKSATNFDNYSDSNFNAAESVLMDSPDTNNNTSGRSSRLSRSCSKSVYYAQHGDSGASDISSHNSNDSYRDPDFTIKNPTSVYVKKTDQHQVNWLIMKKKLEDLRKGRELSRQKKINDRESSASHYERRVKKSTFSLEDEHRELIPGIQNISVIKGSTNCFQPNLMDPQLNNSTNGLKSNLENIYDSSIGPYCAISVPDVKNGCNSYPDETITNPEFLNSRYAAHIIKRRQRGLKKKVRIETMRKYRRTEPFLATYPKLLALVYMACCINGERILLLDLLRWCHSDHLPFSTLPYLLPDSIMMLSRYDLNQLRECKNVPNHSKVRSLVGRLCLLLESQLMPVMDANDVAVRILHALCLPDSMVSSVVSMSKLYHRNINMSTIVWPSREVAVGAAVVQLLKVQWGLDGVQERLLSKQVTVINSELDKSNPKLFCFLDWHRHMSRVGWFNQVVEPCLVRRCDSNAPLNTTIEGGRLANYFWSHGIWRRSRTTSNLDDRLVQLVEKCLHANHTTLTEAVNCERMFQASYHPLTGLAQQYKHCWNKEKSKVSGANGTGPHQMKKVADEICEVSFEHQMSDFLSAISTVQKNLIKSGSKLKVSVASLKHSRYSKKKKTTSEMGKSVDPDELLSMMKDFFDVNEDSSSSTSFEVNTEASATSLESPSVRKGVHISTNTDDAIRNDSSSDTSVEDEDILELVYPPENMWLHPRVVRRNEVGRSDFTALSSSYKWLVKLVADVCCTSVNDIVDHQITIEKYFVGNNIKILGNQMNIKGEPPKKK